jgi:hypothetical protein
MDRYLDRAGAEERRRLNAAVVNAEQEWKVLSEVDCLPRSSGSDGELAQERCII